MHNQSAVLMGDAGFNTIFNFSMDYLLVILHVIVSGKYV